MPAHACPTMRAGQVAATVRRAKAFYVAGGFTINPPFTDHNAACVVIEENHSALMILTRVGFQTVTDRPLDDPKVSLASAVAIFVDGREAVDPAASQQA